MSTRSSARSSIRRKRKEEKKKAVSHPMETPSTSSSTSPSTSVPPTEIQGTSISPPKVTLKMIEEAFSPSSKEEEDKAKDVEELIPEKELGGLKGAIMDHVRKNTCIKVASNIYKDKGKSSIARSIECKDVKILNVVDEDLCIDTKSGAIRMEYLPFAVALRREMGMAMDPIDQVQALGEIVKYLSPGPATCVGKAIEFLEAEDDTDVDISFIMQLPLVLPHIKYSDIHTYRGICLYILHMIDGYQKEDEKAETQSREKGEGTTPIEKDDKKKLEYSLLVHASYESLLRYKSEYSKDYPRKVKASKKGKSTSRVKVAPITKFADGIMDKVFSQEPKSET